MKIDKIWSVYKKRVGTTISLIAVLFLLRMLLNHEGLSGLVALQRVSKHVILISIVWFLIYFYLRAAAWSLLLMSFGQKRPLRVLLGCWFVGELGRYIPGNVWSFLLRADFVEKVAVRRRFIWLSIVWEIILMLLITASWAWLWWTDFMWSTVVLLIMVIAGLFGYIGYYYPHLVRKVEIRNYVLATFLMAGAWFAYGAANAVVMHDILGVPLRDAGTIAIISWLVGYVSLLTPKGLGVREGVIAWLLSAWTGTVLAAAIAILLRLIIVLVEGINTLIWGSYMFQSQLLHLGKTAACRWHWVVVSGLVFIYVVTLSTLSILRHDAFASNFDLANMDQTVWNTSMGRIFQLTSDENTVSRFSIHADIILIFLAPLYWIWDDVRVLLVTQSLVLGLGAIPVYLLAYHLLQNKVVSLVMVFAYLMNPSLQWTNIYDFHPVSFAITFLLFAVYCVFKKDVRGYCFWVLLALLTKEQISLLILMLGVAIYIQYRNKVWAGLSILVGGTWFVLMVFIVMPWFSTEGSHWAWKWYEIGDDTSQQGGFWLSLIPRAWNAFTSPDLIQNYLVMLFKGFAYVPLLGLPWVLVAAPDLMINAISTQAQMRSIMFHYDSGVTPFLTVGMIVGIYWFYRGIEFGVKNTIVAKVALYGISTYLLLGSMRVNYNYSPLPTTPSCWCWVYEVSDIERDFEQALRMIPADARVAASGNVRPHITHREHANTFPGGVENADYLAILTEERMVGAFTPLEFETNLVNELLDSDNYDLIKQTGKFYLFRKSRVGE